MIISPFEKYAELKFRSISKRKNTLETYVNSFSLPDPVEKLLKETFNGIMKKLAKRSKNNKIFHAILVLELGINTLKLCSNPISIFEKQLKFIMLWNIPMVPLGIYEFYLLSPVAAIILLLFIFFLYRIS